MYRALSLGEFRLIDPLKEAENYVLCPIEKHTFFSTQAQNLLKSFDNLKEISQKKLWEETLVAVLIVDRDIGLLGCCKSIGEENSIVFHTIFDKYPIKIVLSKEELESVKVIVRSTTKLETEYFRTSLLEESLTLAFIAQVNLAT